MKTLDKSTAKGWCEEKDRDALHYLKEFKGLSEMWNAKLDKEQENPALTWDELKRKKGHWTGDCCSCCGVSKYNYIKMVDDECGPFGTWNFCPHCGADMRGENEKA